MIISLNILNYKYLISNFKLYIMSSSNITFDEYIFINNETPITSFDKEDFIQINHSEIPLPPLFQNKYINLKVKTRFNDMSHYKKYLENKRKRQRRKNKKNQNFI